MFCIPCLRQESQSKVHTNINGFYTYIKDSYHRWHHAGKKYF